MKKLLIAMAGALAIALTPINASAVTVLTVGDSFYMGSIIPATPSGAANELEYLNALIDLAPNGSTTVGGNLVSRSNNTLCYNTCPDAVSPGLKDETGNNLNIDVSGFLYLYVKYSTDAFVWYVGGLNDLVNLPGSVAGGGLSHYTLYNPSSVPDGGATAGLLGLAILGLGYLRRRMA